MGLSTSSDHSQDLSLITPSEPPSSIPAFFVLKNHLLNSPGGDIASFHWQAVVLGCYESSIHNTAVIDIIGLAGAKNLKSLRKKCNSELGNCESREVNV
jgi:hypothetical protein